MKKPELLAPAGNFNSLVAAIEAGCDAVYLGGKMFGARAYSNNFTNDEIIEAIKYSHLYGVKVYVTTNTLIYEDEVDDFMDYVDFLYKNNVDALIIQDIGMMDLIRKTYPLLELHASTQMHIHNLEGVKLVERLGLKRAVIARETDYKKIEEIKKNTNIELEVFVHGTLCISYSGQCLMSSLIGGRSGNRGSCAGSCRQKYSLISNNEILEEDKYLLSAKDLNSLENIDKLIEIGVDSLKIEGRMKSPGYVYMVTKLYREAIDSYFENGNVDINLEELKKLKKIFNREYTNGFLFEAKNSEIINKYRPNHLGIEIGKVINYKDNMVEILLTDNIHVQDGIRIIDNKDIGFTVINIFKDKEKIKEAESGDKIWLFVKQKINIGSKVVKTTDYLVNKEIEEILKLKKRKVKIDIEILAKIDEKLKVEITDNINKVIMLGDTVERSVNHPITKEKIIEQMTKLGDTVYKADKINIVSDENIFISIKEMNDIRRKAVDKLNILRLTNYDYKKNKYEIKLPDFKKEENYNISLSTVYQYEQIKNLDIHNIYLENNLFDKIIDSRKRLKINRVIDKYKEYIEPLLIGELGGLTQKDIYTDWSLNVVNSYAVAFLHSHNVKQITLSYELNYKQIKDIIDSYYRRYQKHPNLEVVIYGKEEVMISKYKLGEGNDKMFLKDRFNNLYQIINKDNLMHIYNYKIRTDDNNYFKIGINNLRIELLNETTMTDIVKKLIKNN